MWKITKKSQPQLRGLEARVQELEAKLHQLETTQIQVLAVLEGMTEAVIAVDQQERILFINPATENLFQLQQERFRGRNLLEAIRNAPLNELILKSLHDSQSQSQEIEMLTPIQRFFKVQISPLIQQGQTLGAVAVLHDVSELKRLEQVRKEFVANVSHELKTPLTAIQTSVESLLSGALEDSTHNRQFLQRIEQDTERLRNLIEDLLELSRIESREMPLKKEKVSLRVLLEEVISSFKKSLQEKGIQWSLELSSGDDTLMGDRERLHQVFANLLDNAIKYNKERGHIRIRSKTNPDELIIEVEDTGIGIPQRDLARIFERFYRVDKGRSRELGGTGLGLSIVKHIVEAHGGRVWVESQVNQGSSFFLSFPLEPTSERVI